MRALVTGGNGFLGSHLVRRLEEAGHAVRVLAQPGTSLDNLGGTSAEVVRGDVLDATSIADAVRGIETVFHLAALVNDWGPREAFLKVNAGGTRTVCDAATKAGVRRFVLVSSIAVHRFSGIVNGNEDLPRDNVELGYGASKILAEDVVTAAHASGTIEGVIVRPGLFPFGPLDRTSFLPLVQHLGAYAHVAGGRATLCTAYAGNLVHGIALAGEVPAASGRTYVIADGVRLTWRELMDRICDALGRAPIRRSVPYPVAYAAATAMEGIHSILRLRGAPLITRYRVRVAGLDCWFGIDRARTELGYTPPTSVDEGLRRTLRWVKAVL